MKDLYEILGVSKSATTEEIKKKYRSLALQMHPDKLVGKSDEDKKAIEKKFQEITNAYEVLSDENSRKNYDLESQQKSGFGSYDFNEFGNSFSFDDLFTSFFSKESRTKHNSNSNSSRKGEDITLIVPISFRESVNGSKKTFDIDFQKACQSCLQSGANSKEDIKTCDVCRGLGIIETLQRVFLGNVRTQAVCTNCKGSGKIISKKCVVCRGKKFVNDRRSIEIDVPRGLQPDTKRVYRNRGNDGLHNSQKGDIFIEFKVADHFYFKRKNNDIHVELPISFIDAVLGNWVEVVTIEGIEKVKIPQGSQFNDPLILRNKGFYKGIGDLSRGDFYVWLKIKLPRKLSHDSEKVLRDIQERSSWNPNADFINENKKELLS